MDKRVVLFVRCCSPEPASLELQEELLHNFCRKNGYNVVGTVKMVGTGADIEPTLHGVVHKAKMEGADAVVMRDFTRLGRDLVLARNNYSILRNEGMEVLSLDAPNLETVIKEMEQITRHFEKTVSSL